VLRSPHRVDSAERRRLAAELTLVAISIPGVARPWFGGTENGRACAITAASRSRLTMVRRHES
jgi:hypothetical protein